MFKWCFLFFSASSFHRNMPPKRRYDRKAEEALPQIPALRIKGWTSEVVKGIMFGIVYAGKTMADAADACGVDVSTVSRTVRAMEHLLDQDLEALLNPRQPTPDRPTNTDEPSTIAKSIADGQFSGLPPHPARLVLLATSWRLLSWRSQPRRGNDFQPDPGTVRAHLRDRRRGVQVQRWVKGGPPDTLDP
jgi:hypothetical protein